MADKKFALVEFDNSSTWTEEISAELIGKVAEGDEVVVALRRRYDNAEEKKVGTVKELTCVNTHGDEQLGLVISVLPSAESMADRHRRREQRAAVVEQLAKLNREDKILREAAIAVGADPEHIGKIENLRIGEQLRALHELDGDDDFIAEIMEACGYADDIEAFPPLES